MTLLVENHRAVRVLTIDGEKQMNVLSRALVAEEQQHLAPGLQGFALSSGIAVERAQGSVIEDVDGNRYVDLIGGIGVNSLGHCHPAYKEALHAQIEKATVGSFTSTGVLCSFLSLFSVNVSTVFMYSERSLRAACK